MKAAFFILAVSANDCFRVTTPFGEPSFNFKSDFNQLDSIQSLHEYKVTAIVTCTNLKGKMTG
jgi:hypothetical protein